MCVCFDGNFIKRNRLTNNFVMLYEKMLIPLLRLKINDCEREKAYHTHVHVYHFCVCLFVACSLNYSSIGAQSYWGIEFRAKQSTFATTRVAPYNQFIKNNNNNYRQFFSYFPMRLFHSQFTCLDYLNVWRISVPNTLMFDENKIWIRGLQITIKVVYRTHTRIHLCAHTLATHDTFILGCRAMLNRRI